ncbi:MULTISPECIES: helix-turn-helix domain-containing protein [Enterococcaceae]|uniref:Transcriptional regulator n=2 Tax=Enterococcaceae TaxID=81852 RepID=A0A430A2M1_9ENTE|nr:MULTISPECIES: helix-turn-helix domain-containing protein [Enterococcaceae]EJE4563122.1 helix-turn-helix domain-containing protein [Enterococcus faecium]EJX53360.1 DNA-binding helix-turn-helix protein [Enterococcus faecium R497]EKY7883063.1 helix-turn-helix domain-containing protein [Enterococcus faecium]EKZ0059124.1 helix-turn-helix domain-containing protein [Enterococcus faecium]EKZ0497614.1 helix-turn-helix domain-containing protein [Enterococcus faecium]
MSENYSGDLLKSLRKEQKMSQTKLAELSGISQSALVKYEKGTRKISKEIDNALSKVLNIDTLLKNDEVDCLIDQLIHYRDINDLSNKNLAFEMEISEVSLSYFLNRKRKPSKELQRRITIFLLDKEKEMLLEIKQKDGSFNFPIVDKDALGERIQVIRKLRGETLEKFGKNFTRPVGKNVLNRWEKGMNIPDIERLMNVAYIGNVTVSYILFGDNFSHMLAKGKEIRSFERLDSYRMGLRLRKIRRDHRLEREDFGKFFSPPITKWSMDKYENGKDIPNTVRLVQYAYIGKVSLEFLIYGI